MNKEYQEKTICVFYMKYLKRTDIIYPRANMKTLIKYFSRNFRKYQVIIFYEKNPEKRNLRSVCFL